MSTVPDQVDVIILGTGLTNSILAAACSRIGKSVLHLDENNYYGNDWASFTFQQLLEWIESKYPNDKSLQDVPEELINKSRMFCLDLSPRFLFSNGDMVELLVKSNVARYHEFKNNIRILCSIDDEIHVMPCRRNEVFTSTLLSNLADKRRLMKFIELCLRYNPDETVNEDDELKACGDKPIKQCLVERGLRPALQEYIINSIAMVKPTDTTREACKAIKKFMIATERYGKSPFLFPLYGCGEFPQSFCRLSAVFGGLYCLNTQIKNIEAKKIDELAGEEHPVSNRGHFSVQFSTDNHTVKSDVLVVEQAGAMALKLSNSEEITKKYLSRAILITKQSIVPQADSLDQGIPSSQDLVSFLRIPPSDNNAHLIFLIELNSSALVCPKDLNIIYAWTQSASDNPEDDLRATVQRLFKSDTSGIVWQFYYRQLTDNQSVFSGEPPQRQSSPGLYITSPSCDDIDYASIVKESERIFKQMCPEEEFLPRAPDPDEIISS